MCHNKHKQGRRQNIHFSLCPRGPLILIQNATHEPGLVRFAFDVDRYDGRKSRSNTERCESRLIDSLSWLVSRGGCQTHSLLQSLIPTQVFPGAKLRGSDIFCATHEARFFRPALPTFCSRNCLLRNEGSGVISSHELQLLGLTSELCQVVQQCGQSR